MAKHLYVRRLPVGAEVTEEGTHFRVWAPDHQALALVLEGGSEDLPMTREADGHFSLLAPEVGAGARYRFRLDDGELYPDPASRFQPEGPLGSSEVIDPCPFTWTDASWRGCRLQGQVIYEMHIGTFTPEGTFDGAARELPRLAELGVTLLELMPLADFCGPFGWGYDGVNYFAPCRLYGRPDDLRRFIDSAHALGMGVLLDFVCNHLGPEGCHLPAFSSTYVSQRHKTEWGATYNFDGPGCEGVRELFLASAACWIEEYHFDGFRVDATQDVHDESPRHILSALVSTARVSARTRDILVIGENEPQKTSFLRPLEDGGYGFDALWNDDFHHSARVGLTGQREAYYEDHQGAPQEFVSAAKYGYLFQGQHYCHQSQRRGSSTRGLPAAAFVNYLENHDQVANSGRGERLHLLSSPGRWRAMSALLLLLPGTPLLFQGQEYGSSRPFLYFADCSPALREAVLQGRAGFISQFPSVATPEMMALLDAPHEPATFERCKLDPAERDAGGPMQALYRDLLRLRREDPLIAAQGAGGLDGAVLGAEAFALRWWDSNGDDRLLLVNLGPLLLRASFPEPLLAPPAGRAWGLLWSSEDPRYGGGGTPPVESEGPWRLPAQAAVVLRPVQSAEAPGVPKSTGERQEAGAWTYTPGK